MTVPYHGGARNAGPLGFSSGGVGGRVPGPMGSTLWDKQSPSPAPAATKKPKAATTKEITLVGDFKNPFTSIKEEVKAMKEGRWEPSTDDFQDVGGRVARVDSYLSVLGAILVEGDSETHAGSISRINIFTHANSNLIALGGRIEVGSISTNVLLNVQNAISSDTLDNLNNQGAIFNVQSKVKKLAKKDFTLDDVRARFAKDAVIVLYACRSGVEGALLQRLADTFQVKVIGFTDLIGYFPNYTEVPARVTNRRRVGVGRNSKVVESDFHKLDSSSSAVTKSPRTP